MSATSYREMTTPARLTSGRPMNYGFGLMPDTLGGHRVIQHGGGINGFISHLMYMPQDTLTVVVLANTAPAPSEPVATAIARAVLGLPAATPTSPKDLPLSAADRAKYVGNYALTFPDGAPRHVKIVDENEALWLTMTGARAKMQSQGGDVFVAPGQGRIVFDVVNGRATGFQLGAGGVRPLEAVREP